MPSTSTSPTTAVSVAGSPAGNSPTTLLDTIGPRPTSGPAARQWDQIAGHLSQHQAAFALTAGIGPPPLAADAYAANQHHLLEHLPTIGRPQRVPTIEYPDLGLSL